MLEVLPNQGIMDEKVDQHENLNMFKAKKIFYLRNLNPTAEYVYH